MPLDPATAVRSLRDATEVLDRLAGDHPEVPRSVQRLAGIADALEEFLTLPTAYAQGAEPQVVNAAGPTVAALPELTPAVRTLVDRARRLALEAEEHEEDVAHYRQTIAHLELEAMGCHAQRIDLERALANLGPEGAAGLVALAGGEPRG